MMWNGADILGIFQGDPLNCCNTDLVICAEAALSHTSRFIFHHTPFTDHICYKGSPRAKYDIYHNPVSIKHNVD